MSNLAAIKELLSNPMSKSGMFWDKEVLDLFITGFVDNEDLYDIDTLDSVSFDIGYDGWFNVEVEVIDTFTVTLVPVATGHDGQMYDLTEHIVGRMEYPSEVMDRIKKLLWEDNNG